MSTFIDPTIARGRVERTGQQLHKLGDREVSASLIGMLDDEAKDGGWWAVIARSNGDLLYRYNKLAILPDEEHQILARALAISLNREIHQNGVWIVGWFDAHRRLAMFWKDSDGDVHVVIDYEEPWARLRQVKVGKIVEDCVAAWRRWWLDFQAPLDLKDGDMAKVAQGETQPRSTN